MFKFLPLTCSMCLNKVRNAAICLTFASASMFLLISNEASAQAVNVGPISPFSNNGNVTRVLGINDIFGKPVSIVNQPNISGSPYMNEAFKKGKIMLSNGVVVNDVMVRVNLYSNELGYLKDGVEYTVDSFSVVSYWENPEDASTVTMFRSGYPAIAGKTRRSIYQVLAGGESVQLLKFIQRKLEEKKDIGYTNLKEFNTYQEYYLYSKKDGLRKIRLNSKDVTDALPSYKDQIAKVVADNKMNLKKEFEIAFLADALNNVDSPAK